MKPGAFLCLLLLSLTSAVSADEWIMQAYREAGQLEARGLYNEASAALQPVLKKYPNGYAVNLRLGWLAYLASEHVRSEHYYKQASQILPYSFEPRIALLLPLLASQQWKVAEQTAYQVLKDDPYNYYANIRLLKALQAQLKYALAQRQSEKLLERYPLDIPLLQSLEISLSEQGEKEGATAVRNDIEILTAGYIAR